MNVCRRYGARFTAALIVLGLSGQSFADDGVAAATSTASANVKSVSVLREPENVELYQPPIAHASLWVIRTHGIRSAPLDPRVWGARLDQRTENHRLISIKPYYLRSSESPGYRVDKISLSFVLRPATPDEILRSPHEKDAVLEIGFGGELVLQPGGREPARDREYAMRISGYPYVASGLLYRSQSREVLLHAGKQISLKNRSVHHFEGLFTDSTAVFKLDGTEIGELSAQTLGRPLDRPPNRGLISLVSSWQPATVLSLQIEGHDQAHPLKEAIIESGLVTLPKPKPHRAPGKQTGPRGNEVLDHALFRTQEDFETPDGGSSDVEPNSAPSNEEAPQ